MKRIVETFDAGGAKAYVSLPGNGGPAAPLPVLCMLSGEDMPAELDAMLREARRLPGGDDLPPFLACSFEPIRWNRTFSPWPAPALREGGEPFPGGGRDTLSLLEDALLPELARRYGASGERGERAILGYSLSGLFALWAMYESDAFGSCACASGSLWYDGWMDRMRQGHPRPGSRVYLSLGRREEKTRNRRFASIGDLTREAAALLEADGNVAKSALVWHDGGHDHEVTRRLAQGMIWLVAVTRGCSAKEKALQPPFHCPEDEKCSKLCKCG